MGIFGTSKRGSSESGSVSKSAGSTVSKKSAPPEGNSQSSRSVPGPPSKRGPLPRQVTTDHITPPPIRDGEIDALKQQIEDLSRCTDNPAVFELLLSDIDRNRLTQMTMIFADRGDYPTMARVMELSDLLDRLIREQVEEAHKRQRMSLRSNSQSNLSLDDFLQEADTIAGDTNLTASELRAKIQTFDQCYSEFQDSPFEKLILLSEKVEILRNKLTTMSRTERGPSLPSPPASPEPWVRFDPPAGDPSPLSISSVHINEDDANVQAVEESIKVSNIEQFSASLQTNQLENGGEPLPSAKRVEDPNELFNIKPFSEQGVGEGGDQFSTSLQTNECAPRVHESDKAFNSEQFPNCQETNQLDNIGEDIQNDSVSTAQGTDNRDKLLKNEQISDHGHGDGLSSSLQTIQPDNLNERSNDKPASSSIPINEFEGQSETFNYKPASSSVQINEVEDASRSTQINDIGQPLEEESTGEKVKVVEDHLRIQRLHVMRIVLSAWTALPSATEIAAECERKKIERILKRWRVAAHVSARKTGRVRKSLRAWRSVQEEARALEQHTLAEYERRLRGPVIAAWQQFTVDLRNKVFTLETAVRERTQAWILKTWYKETCSRLLNRELESSFVEQESSFEEIGVNTEELSESEPAWIEMAVTQRYNNELLRNLLYHWHNQCVPEPASVSPLRGLGIIATEPDAAPTSPEAWLEEFPEGAHEAPDDSRASIPDSVEHYIIHDSPPERPVVDIRAKTEEIIARAQMFLSQKQLRPLSPPPTRPVFKTVANMSLQPLPSGDKYFSWFDQKWADEEKLWRL